MLTCKQLEKVDDDKLKEDNQLSIKQTTESRFVTKVSKKSFFLN